MNQARTLVELGDFYAANLLTEKKSTFPGKDTFKVQKEKSPKAAEAKKDAFITSKSKLGSGPEASDGFVPTKLDPKHIKKVKNDEYGVLKDSPAAKDFSISAEKNEVQTINNFMNKSIFDRLYEEVMSGEQPSLSHDDIESADAEALDLPTAEGEGDEITITIDRSIAKKLHDVLMSVLGDTEHEVEDEVEGEDEDEEMGDESPALEATEIKELGDKGSQLTGKNNKVHDATTHDVDGKEGDGKITAEVDAKGKPCKTVTGGGTPSNKVAGKVTSGVGKNLFAAAK